MYGMYDIVLDVRCLQDPNYSERGIGRHALAILRHVPRTGRIIGLTDPTLPALLPEACEIVDEIHVNAYAAGKARAPVSSPACFVMLSPMTHDPLFAARLLSDPAVLCAAPVYDFIPTHSPDQYLPGPAERLSYMISLRWLARCSLFAPISRSTASELKTLLKVPDNAITVTGCPLDPTFEGLAAAPELPSRHLLVMGGDLRKNPEVVIRAHARSSMMQAEPGIPLVIVGPYRKEDSQMLRAIAAAAGGRGELVETPGHVSHATLLNLYRWALLMVCASRDEGFSLPVIEGMAAGLPCLASDIPAHAELITDATCRFIVEDDAALSLKLERAVGDADWRTATLTRQARVWPRYRAKVVAERFWNAVRYYPGKRSPLRLRIDRRSDRVGLGGGSG